MGEIADSMINGDFDFITGEYIGNGGGFPRTRYFKSEKNARYGVTKFLERRGFKQNDLGAVVRKYAEEVLSIKTKKYTKICEAIQQDFGQFVKWINKTHNHETP